MMVAPGLAPADLQRSKMAPGQTRARLTGADLGQWAFVLGSSVRDRIVLRAVSGLMLGYAFLTAVVAAGIAALVAGSPTALTILTLAGAAYLIYLGTSILTRPSTLQPVSTQDQDTPTPAWWSWVVRGSVSVGSTRRDGWCSWRSFPNSLTPRDAGRRRSRSRCSASSSFCTCSAVYSCVGLGARAVLGSRPGISRLIPRISGVAMILIGIGLLLERLLPMISRVHT
jgi:threonine/homoserine/homoserine lactone efflux protein